MQVTLLASGREHPEYQFLTTLLVNDTVAIDAGCLGLYGAPRDQARVTHIFLTHSHADHVLSLPMFLTNIQDIKSETVVGDGGAPVLDSLKTDIFNGRVWPNFLQLSRDGVPIVVLDEVTPQRPVTIDGVTMTAIPVNHVVPTCAYIVDDGHVAIVFSPDSGPTDALWAAARRVPNLKTVFMGVAFPNAMHALAERAGHLTPQSLRTELAKLPDRVSVVAIHLKPTYRAQIIDELDRLAIDNLTIEECGRRYSL